MRPYLCIAVGVLTTLVSACGGGASGATGPATAQLSKSEGTADFQVTVPLKMTSTEADRAEKYVSLNTMSFVIFTDGANPQTLDLSINSPNCRTINNDASLSCTTGISTTGGTHTFSMVAYSQPNGQGSALSTNAVGPILVNSGASTSIPITLQGIVASVALRLISPNPPIGTAIEIPLTVVLKDASGATIVGSAALDNPVTLSSSDALNAPLSSTLLNSPADTAAITANYNGADISLVTYSASGSGFTSAAVTNAILTPTVTAIATATPPAAPYTGLIH
jgi:hypothetical protein